MMNQTKILMLATTTTLRMTSSTAKIWTKLSKSMSKSKIKIKSVKFRSKSSRRNKLLIRTLTTIKKNLKRAHVRSLAQKVVLSIVIATKTVMKTMMTKSKQNCRA
jgi:hypothetical protein